MACRWKICLLLFCGLFSLIQSSLEFIERCGKNDEVCMIKSANNAIKYIAGGIPSLDIKSIDPIIPNDVEGDSDRFTYKFTNNSITGFGQCQFNHIKLNLDLSTLLFDIKCPSLIIQGQYEVSGELVDLPLKRNGTYKVTTGLYFINFETEIEKVLGSDGEHHLAIKTYVVAGQPKEPIDFKFHRFTPNVAASRNESGRRCDAAWMSHDASGINATACRALDATSLCFAQTHFDQVKFKELHVLTRDAYRAAVFGPLFTYVNRFLAMIPFRDLFTD